MELSRSYEWETPRETSIHFHKKRCWRPSEETKLQSLHISIIPNRTGKQEIHVFSFANDFKNTALKSLMRGEKKVMEKAVWCRKDKFWLCVSILILCARYLQTTKAFLWRHWGMQLIWILFQTTGVKDWQTCSYF